MLTHCTKNYNVEENKLLAKQQPFCIVFLEKKTQLMSFLDLIHGTGKVMVGLRSSLTGTDNNN